MAGAGEPLRIHCLAGDQWAHIQPVEASFGPRAHCFYDRACDPSAIVRQLPDLVLTVSDWPLEIAVCLAAASKAGIPTLTLQDGILEWRCQYENPLFGFGGGPPQHQPVLAHKIACIGYQNARTIAAWGNPEKVEVTGMPRLDGLLNRAKRPLRSPGTRLLVMTAKNPGFTPSQRVVTLRSLEDVRDCLSLMPHLEVLWRVSRDIAESLGVTNSLERLGSSELAEIVEHVDAVITTPSTAMLEAMLLGRPVAALDYHNVPRFVPTAWTICCREQIPLVLAELQTAPASKMAFQNHCLRDALACDGPAAPRVVSLIEKMVYAAWRARAEGVPLRLGANLVFCPAGPDYFALPPLSELYPDQPVFRETAIPKLQARLARVEKKNLELRRELERRSLRNVLHAALFRVARGRSNRG
jgi:hypothetical protein